MSQTSQSDDAGALQSSLSAEMPVIPNPAKLYNELMWVIEPELTTGVLPTLPEKYKGETDADAEARAERYRQAYEKFQVALLAYFDKLNGKIREYGRKASASLEKLERESEEQAMERMESDIQNS